MNEINIQQAGGFPLETDDADFMQKAYSIFNALGMIAGNWTIISGCDDNSTTVTDGVVNINGEVLEFRGGAKTDNVRITEEIRNKTFKDGQNRPVYKTRFVEFGAGVPENQFPWSRFKRILSNKDLQGRLLPPGTNPQLYCGSEENVPQGWQLCDGTNGTPDLRDRFILGTNNFEDINEAGGSHSKAISIANLPSHTHAMQGAGSHTHPVRINTNKDGDGVPAMEEGNGLQLSSGGWLQVDYAGNHVHTLEETGEGQPLDVRGKYYKLAYIIYTNG